MKNFMLCSILVLGVFTSLFGQTFTEIIAVDCGDTAFIEGLGYPTWNEAMILRRPSYGYGALTNNSGSWNSLIFSAPPCFIGKDTVVIACARATQITCDTGVYVFDIGCRDTAKFVYAYTVNCRDSVFTNELSSWGLPVIIDSAQHGRSRIWENGADGAGVFYLPEFGFEGLDVVKVKNQSWQDTVVFLFQVYCSPLSSVENAVTKSIILSPNPSNEVVYFPVEVAPIRITVTDYFGREVVSIVCDEMGRFALPVAHLPSGQYIVQGISVQKRWAGRFQKQ